MERKDIEKYCSNIMRDFEIKDVDFPLINEAIDEFYKDIELFELNDKKCFFITSSATSFVSKSDIISITSSSSAYQKFIKVCENDKDEDIAFLAILEEHPTDVSKLIIKSYIEVKRDGLFTFKKVGDIKRFNNPIIINKGEVEIKNEKLFSYNDLVNNNIYNL